MKALKIINLIFFLVMVTVNALANILPLGHGNTGAISGKYPNLYTPAPITFSIWGVIYILVALFVLYQMSWFGNRDFAESLTERISIWFIISCIMNIGWLFSWHYERIGISMIFMLGLLISLIVIVTKISPKNLSAATGEISIPLLARFSVWAFDIYLGWITAATIANFSVWLVKVGWNRFGLSEQFWTVAMLLIGVIIGILFIITGSRYMSAAALMWAYCGILIKHVSQSGHAGKYPLIIAVTIVGIVLILCTGVLETSLKKCMTIQYSRQKSG